MTKRSLDEIDEDYINGAEKTKNFTKYLNIIGILGLAIGLAVHRYLLKDKNVDIYFSGFAALVMIVNIAISYFFSIMVTSRIEIIRRRQLDSEDEN